MNMVLDDREGFAAFLLRLRALGMPPKDLVAALEATPRKTFCPALGRSVAWSDRMVPIECGETIEGADLQAASSRRCSSSPDIGCWKSVPAPGSPQR